MRLSATSLSKRASRSGVKPASEGCEVCHSKAEAVNEDVALAASVVAAPVINCRRPIIGCDLGSHPLDDVLGHLLGVAEQHHGVVAVEQRIVDAGIAGG